MYCIICDIHQITLAKSASTCVFLNTLRQYSMLRTVQKFSSRMPDMTEGMEITLVIWNWCVVANIWYQGHANCLDTDTHNDCDLGDDLPQSERLSRGVKNYGSAISSSVYLCSSDFCSHDFMFSILAWVALLHLNLLEAIAGIFMITLVLTVWNAICGILTVIRIIYLCLSLSTAGVHTTEGDVVS
jgi:hypothetical protein